mmetsp:Transcript_20610/g.21390  ORF Transcript_20610/g.21390 Transcript_20610/m.21390 type:complete len:553 (-) Transcript_20610:39-1697(-)
MEKTDQNCINKELKQDLLEEVKDKLQQFNQEHLLSVYSSTKVSEQEKVLKDLLSIDYELLNRLSTNNQAKETVISKDNISVLEVMTDPRNFSEDERQRILTKGIETIYKGEFALLILAGGQGSRLGSDDTKGKYDIQMPSNKSLFEYRFERVKAIQNMSKSIVEIKYSNNDSDLKYSPSKILIQTSEENHSSTINYLKDKKFFGFQQEDVIVFPQEMIPAVDTKGKILLKSESEIFKNPNGNGGCFSTIKNSKILDHCKQSLGIKFLQVVSIDNPLIKALDPLYIGWHIYQKSLMSAKFIEKTVSTEKVGVFLKYKDSAYMLDYGQTPPEILVEKDSLKPDKLKYRAGNILNYIINTDHLDAVLNNPHYYNILIQEYNSAKKKISAYDVDTKTMTTVDGYKYEIFFNSIFQFCPKENSLALYQTEREEEFSPVKNKEGEVDSPSQVRRSMTRMFYNWLVLNNYYIMVNLKKQGKRFILGKKDLERCLIEIDFNLAYDERLINHKELSEKYKFIPKEEIGKDIEGRELLVDEQAKVIEWDVEDEKSVIEILLS